MTDTRDDAQLGEQQVRALVEQWARLGLISREQADAILRSERLGEAPADHLAARSATSRSTARAAAGHGASPAAQRNRLVVEALGYLGGVLATAAALLLVQMFWGDLSDLARLAIPMVAALGLLAAGAAVPDEATGAAESADLRGRLRSALWLLAVAAFVAGLAVLGHRILDWDGLDTSTFAFGGGAIAALALYARQPAVAQHLALFATSVVTAATLGARLDWEEPVGVGFAAWLVAVAWFVLGETRRLPPPELAGLLGAAMAVAAALMTGQNLPGQLLAMGTVLALFAWGVRADSLGFLAIAAIGTIGVVPSAVSYFFPDNTRVAVPLGLLAIGAVLVTTAVLVARRRARGSAEVAARHG